MIRARYCFVLLVWSLAGIPAQALLADPRDLVQDTTERVLEQVRVDRESLENNPEKMFSLVDEVVFPHFDFPRISQWVLGKNWRQAQADERQEFMNQFRRLLVRTYSSALLEFQDTSITYGEAQQKPESKTASVLAALESDSGEPVPIMFRMHERDGPWKVFDVSVDGVSLVSTYRASFAAEIQQNGMEGLIDSLRAKNAEQAEPTE